MLGSRLLRAFDDAVMPLRCVFCGTRTLDGERYVCAGCCADLPWRASPPPPPPLTAIVAPLDYEFPLDAAIKALKFKRRLWYGPALAQLACLALDDLPGEIDGVLPVPLHWRRQWWRGFNQAQEIAHPLAGRLGVPLLGGVRRVRATRPQSGLRAGERARNLQGAFSASRPCLAQHVLIVDDVMTTGATLSQVATVVLGAGAASVSALVIARA